jgi:hypothetical protein
MDVGNLLMKVSDNYSVRRAFGTAYEKDGILPNSAAARPVMTPLARESGG